MAHLLNAAQWHADKACAAYLSGDLDLFCRRIAIRDRLTEQARGAAREAA